MGFPDPTHTAEEGDANPRRGEEQGFTDYMKTLRGKEGSRNRRRKNVRATNRSCIPTLSHECMKRLKPV